MIVLKPHGFGACFIVVIIDYAIPMLIADDIKVARTPWREDALGQKYDPVEVRNENIVANAENSVLHAGFKDSSILKLDVRFGIENLQHAPLPGVPRALVPSAAPCRCKMR